MKKNELVAIACLLCFCCCNGTEKEVPNPDLQEELSPIQFTIDLQKEVLPFPVTKSIPELNIPEPIPQIPMPKKILLHRISIRIIYTTGSIISYTKAENRTFW